MESKLTPLLILALIASASAWSQENLLDFTNASLQKTDCGSLNFSMILNVESVNEPSVERLDLLMNSNASKCENFVRGAYHYFELTDPKPSCERFYQTVHDWWGLWNWKFADCGIVFSKSNADKLIDIYSSDFWTGELDVDVALEVMDYSPWMNQTANETPAETEDGWSKGFDFFGGGGMSLSEGSVWETWLFMPNILWIEGLIAGLAFVIGRKIWTTSEFKSVVSNMSDSPGRAVLLTSPGKKLHYFLVIFVVINIAFFVAWFTLI